MEPTIERPAPAGDRIRFHDASATDGVFQGDVFARRNR